MGLAKWVSSGGFYGGGVEFRFRFQICCDLLV